MSRDLTIEELEAISGGITATQAAGTILVAAICAEAPPACFPATVIYAGSQIDPQPFGAGGPMTVGPSPGSPENPADVDVHAGEGGDNAGGSFGGSSSGGFSGGSSGGGGGGDSSGGGAGGGDSSGGGLGAY